MNGMLIGLTVASGVLFLGTALFFLATLKLYTEYFKDKSASNRKGGS
jgi:hypothetical protein